MSYYSKIIETFTDINPDHVESVMREDFRTLDGLPVSTFKKYAMEAAEMGPDYMEAEHNAICGAYQ